MAVWDARAVQCVSSFLLTAAHESCSALIGLITLAAKCAGARSAGNPHATCDAAGAGNGATVSPNRARRGKPRTQPRIHLRATAPVLDPTSDKKKPYHYRWPDDV
jgi:hypothetical protein